MITTWNGMNLPIKVKFSCKEVFTQPFRQLWWRNTIPDRPVSTSEIHILHRKGTFKKESS